VTAVEATGSPVGGYRWYCEGDVPLLFTENETNYHRIFSGENRTPYVKDAFHACVMRGQTAAVNPDQVGTKAAAHYRLTVGAGASGSIRLRLKQSAAPGAKKSSRRTTTPFGREFDTSFEARRREADEFYATVIPASLDADAAGVIRQALAGMLWSKQLFHYDVHAWLEEHGADPFNPIRRVPRNEQWHHMHNADIISMPDKWEYPWYAAWDLAFHVAALTMVDEQFGKDQLELMLKDRYLHPNGQIPAYEWNFGDVNPPVHAWSTIFT
jgi:hypothetical protein